MDSLKVLDPEWPIREADIRGLVAASPFGARKRLMHCSKFDAVSR
jgi:hypothetical protein